MVKLSGRADGGGGGVGPAGFQAIHHSKHPLHCCYIFLNVFGRWAFLVAGHFQPGSEQRSSVTTVRTFFISVRFIFFSQGNSRIYIYIFLST